MQASLEFIKQLNIQLKKSKSTLPRYKELYEALRQQVLDGLLLPGMRLPSSRTIAKELGIARNTALTAIEQLCAEGYANARSKSGIYIVATTPIHWETHYKITPKKEFELSRRGKLIAEQSSVSTLRGAFAPGIPDIKQFPFDLWQRYIARYARNPKLEWQMNPNQGGIFALRQVLADYLRAARGITCDADQILITHGTQHSLRLIADLLADHHDIIWIENPGYNGARCAFTAAGLNIIHQPVDQEGISPAKNSWKKPPRFIYTTPSHQFPTGIVMSAARRRNLLALAAQHHTWIIEDDYDSEFRYEGSPLAALHALAPKQVIYLGTFSKTFFLSMRIGYMILPKPLIPAFRTTQARHHREPSYIIQNALVDFIRDGHASSHIRKMRREYQMRHDILVKLLQQELGDQIRLSGFETGLHVVIYLPLNTDDEMIATEAHKKGIMIGALSRYYANKTTTNLPGLVLGFGNSEQKEILQLGKILCRIVRKNLFS